MIPRSCPLAAVVVASASLAFGCGNAFTAATETSESTSTEGSAATGSTSGDPACTSGGSGTAMPGDGCSDGVREAFVDAAMYPDVAGCAGGFQVPGIASGLALQPKCNRAGGNDGANPA